MAGEVMRDRLRAVQKMRAAAGLIREKGWTRGVLTDETGRMCILGALYASSTDDGVTVIEQDSLRKILRRECPVAGTWANPISYWNDYVCQNGEQACELLERAAAELEGSDLPSRVP